MQRALGAGLALATAVAGCATRGAAGLGGPGMPRGPVARTAPAVTVAASLTPHQLGADDTAFGFGLFARLCATDPTGNLVLSPASAGQALGMLQAGADPAAAAALSRLLRLPAWGPALVASLHAQSAELAAIRQLAVSNHVYEQPGRQPAAALLAALRDGYRAGLAHLDFATHPGAATAAIDAAVRRDTGGLIPSLFDSPLPASTVVVITDAISLDARWLTPFPVSRPGAFTTADGRSVPARLMTGDELRLPYRAVDGWQAVTLPYWGGRLKAVALLPPAGSRSCAAPSDAALAALTDGPAGGAVGVRLPELRLTSSWDLLAALTRLGLPTTGYPGYAGGSVAKVVQKAVLQVDRAGTRAAAATGIAMTTALMLPTRIVTFDRPFLLLLRDTTTGTPLFLARVTDPTRS